MFKLYLNFFQNATLKDHFLLYELFLRFYSFKTTDKSAFIISFIRKIIYLTYFDYQSISVNRTIEFPKTCPLFQNLL